jgi:hypothetical protein
MHGLLLSYHQKRWNDCFSLVKFSNICQAQETIELNTQNLHGTLVAGGANFNFYRGSTQQMNASFTSPKTFHDGWAGLSLHRF